MTRQMAGHSRVGLAQGLGALWALALLWVAARFVQVPVFALMPTIMTAFLAPGLILMLMIGRVSMWPARDPRRAVIDRQAMRDTLAQLALALAIWPAAAVILGGHGPGVIASLGLGLALARLAFWIGAHLSPALRAFGVAASFLPTVFVALWAIWKLVFGVG